MVLIDQAMLADTLSRYEYTRCCFPCMQVRERVSGETLKSNLLLTSRQVLIYMPNNASSLDLPRSEVIEPADGTGNVPGTTLR